MVADLKVQTALGEPRATEVDAACAELRLLLQETRHASRRELLRKLGGTAAGAALLAALPRGLASEAHAAEQPVTAFVFGGVWKRSAAKAFGEPFTQQTGIPMQYQEPYTFARLRAMHEAKAQQIDVVSLQGNEILVAEHIKMLTPLDWSVIDRSVLSDRQLSHPDAIGSHTLSYVVCYNKKRWGGDVRPNSWADFWDVEKFPGRRVLRRDPIWTMEAALKADGVKDGEFYPLDVDRAFRSLDRIRPHVKSWYFDNSQGQQLMEQEEVDLIAMVNGRASDSIINHGAPFEIVWNEAICEGGQQGWVAPIGCPNPKGAMRFLNVVGRAEYQAVFARLMFYSPQNPKALDLLPPDLVKVMPTYPANEKLAHIIDYNWWANDGTAVLRRFERWLQS